MVTTTLWQERAAMRHAHLSESVSAGQGDHQQSPVRSGQCRADAVPGARHHQPLVDQQAYTLAASDMFYAPALISLALSPLVFLIRHTKSRVGSGDAAAGRIERQAASWLCGGDASRS